MSFIVFASPKSGTTWLQRLLSHHPAALCAESRAFGDYYAAGPSAARPHLTLDKYCGILKDYFAPALPEFGAENRTFNRTLTHNFLDTLATTALAATHKKIYGEKFTPYRGTAAQALEALEQYNPKIKFVNLIRDGRDVIASGAAHWLNLRLRQAQGGERESLEDALRSRTILEDDFEMFLDCWTDAAQAGLAARGRFPHYLCVRYEDFLEDPESQTARLFDFLGLRSKVATVRACVQAASFNRLSGGRRRGEEDPASFFRKGVTGDWENWFTAEQQMRFEETAGPLLEELGYARGEDLGIADCGLEDFAPEEQRKLARHAVSGKGALFG